MRFVLLFILLALFTKKTESERAFIASVRCDDGLAFEVFTKADFYSDLASRNGIPSISENVDLAHVLYLLIRAKHYQVPERIAVRWIYFESKFDSVALSPDNAFGYAQIIPATWKELSCKLNLQYTATNNIEAGLYYLSSHYERFGRWDLALAAYNAGPNCQALKHGRIPNYSETKTYIQRILR